MELPIPSINEFLQMTTADLKEYAKSKSISTPRGKQNQKPAVFKAILSHLLDRMTIAEIKEYAVQNSISVLSRAKKQDLISNIIKNVIASIEIDNQPTSEFDVTKDPPGRTLLQKETGEGRFILGVYTICQKCGNELFAFCRTELDTESSEDHKELTSLFKTCPNCRAKLGLVEGRFEEHYGKGKEDNVFQHLTLKIAEEEKRQNQNQVREFINSIKKHQDMPSGNATAQTVRSSVDLLKQYILYLIHIESEVFLLTERITTLKMQNRIMNQSEIRAKERISKGYNAALKTASKNCTDAIGKYQSEIKEVDRILEPIRDKIRPSVEGLAPPTEPVIQELQKPIPPVQPTLSTPLKPNEPVYQQPGLFNKRKVNAENQIIKDRYEKEIRQYNEELESYNNTQSRYQADLNAYHTALLDYEERIKELKSMQTRYQKAKEEYDAAYLAAVDAEYRILKTSFVDERQEAIVRKKNELLEKKDTISKEKTQKLLLLPFSGVYTLLAFEQNELKNELKNVVETRNELYKYNIIYEKYRSYTYLTTLYEYLDSGRCAALEGPNGAYNLLETESRTNEIILQLNSISASLEAIKSNQFMLYKELRQVNHYLNSIDQSLQHAIGELASLNASAKEMNSLLSEIKGEVQLSSTNLSSINRTTKSIQSSSEGIYNNTSSIAVNSAATAHYSAQTAQNTALTAYYSSVTAHYSKVNAELTNALGFMIALK